MGLQLDETMKTLAKEMAELLQLKQVSLEVVPRSKLLVDLCSVV